MKKLLLILVLCLVPLSVADACPGRGPCGCPGGEVPLVTVDDTVANTLDLMHRIAENAARAADQIGFHAGPLMMEALQYAIEDEEVITQIQGEFQKGGLLFNLAMEDMAEGSKIGALATLETGPVAASLRLSAASKFASATAKFLRSCECLDEVIKIAEKALEAGDDEGPSA